MKRLSMLAAMVVAACATVPRASNLADGELALPGGYQTWPKFLSAVQRPDVRQVREIYVNPVGLKTRAGDAYAQGTTFVMENWTVKTNTDGQPITGADGKMVKDRIAKIFVMQKGVGFGANVPKELKTGDWAYGSFDDAGGKIAEQFNTCRGCHVPHASKDYVWRYDEHFAARR